MFALYTTSRTSSTPTNVIKDIWKSSRDFRFIENLYKIVCILEIVDVTLNGFRPYVEGIEILNEDRSTVLVKSTV